MKSLHPSQLKIRLDSWLAQGKAIFSGAHQEELTSRIVIQWVASIFREIICQDRDREFLLENVCLVEEEDLRTSEVCRVICQSLLKEILKA